LSRAGGIVEVPDVVEAAHCSLPSAKYSQSLVGKYSRTSGDQSIKGFNVNEKENIANKIEDLL
jgi:hypothetical protein